MRRVKAIPGTLPLFPTESTWKAPSLSDLPSWKDAKRVGFDTEFRDDTIATLGIGSRRGAKLAGFSFMLEGHRPFYVPLRHPEGNVDCEQGLNYLRDNIHGFKGELIGANINVDLDLIYYEGIEPQWDNIVVQDVQIRDPLIHELHFKYSFEAIAERRNTPTKNKELLRQVALEHGYDVSKRGWEGCIASMPAKYIGPYGEADASGLFPIYHSQEADIKRLKLEEIVALHAQALPVLLKMRRRGVRIDFNELDKIEAEAARDEAEAINEIKSITGWDIGFGNVNAAARVAPALEAIGIQVPETEEGKPSITKEFLASIDHKVAKLIRSARQNNKIRTTFVASVRRYQTNGRVHTTFRQIVGASEKNEKTGAAFGRLSSCIAKGTLIEVVRDVSAHPKGIAIEDVRPGDLVYSYDDNLKLCLRKVTWAGMTGHRQVVRVHWRGYGGKHTGYTDMTPEHLVRLTNGEYTRADNLNEHDHVMALSRGIGAYGYARLWPTGAPEIPREHRFIHQEVYGFLDDHVHHLNENKLDNRPENLQALPRKDHLTLHAHDISDELREKRRVSTKARWEADYEGMKARTAKPGELHPNWLGFSYEEIYELLADNYWSLTNAAGSSRTDFATFKKYALSHGFDLNELKKLNMQSRRERGVNPFDGRARRKDRGEEKVGNHQILKVELLQETVDVYDLTVEDTHNFIAGEICVHNCHPNLQQQPSKGALAKKWRKIYLPDEGKLWASSDYSGQELRWAVLLSKRLRLEGADEMLKRYLENPRIDQHAETAVIASISRDDSKTMAFAKLYGAGDVKVCKQQLKLPTRWMVQDSDGLKHYFDTRKEALDFRHRLNGKCRIKEVAGVEGQCVIDRFNKGVPFFTSLANRATKKAEETGFVRLLGGRQLNFRLNDKGEYEDAYKALNKVIQGSASSQTFMALIAIEREFPGLLQLAIHDEVCFSTPDIQTAKNVSLLMSNVYKCEIPWRCDLEVGPTWSDQRLICCIPGCLEYACPVDKFGCPEHALKKVS